ncbi:protein NYNRIN-like [Solea solea]|uniref:protein NYNRIN-like n=1 Tax=Solea solea TaxID=90069 RepID=UPI00272AB039|nr:protein NYNRIN-like [Solea solea]
MQQMINTFWFTKGFSAYAQKHCQACVICATHNVGRAIQPSQQAAHPQPTRPFEHVMMDFVELTPSEGKSHCLVMVDMWSKWVEVFPASKQFASVVAKALLTEIIPRWGIPAKISSDNGSHFVNSAITELSLYLGINLRTHCAYHPASGGAVERENGTLKNKLAKCCEDTGLPWTKALPLVLMYMRMRKRNRTNLSPFEILFATPPSVGVETPRSPPPSTALCDHNTLTYCTNLSKQLSDIKKQVIAALPVPASGPLHQLEPGDFVVVKDFRRKSWRNRRWQGPFQILLTTHTAVKVAERATWIHASHCRKVPAPPAGSTEKNYKLRRLLSKTLRSQQAHR